LPSPFGAFVFLRTSREAALNATIRAKVFGWSDFSFAQTFFALGEFAYCSEAPCAAKSVFVMEAQNVAAGPRPRTFSSRSPPRRGGSTLASFSLFPAVSNDHHVWHLHLIASGEARKKLKKRIKRLNQKILWPIADSLSAAHQKRISKGKWLTKSLTFSSHRKKAYRLFSSEN
jgi:hypothetical protein